MPERLDGAAVL
jgi:hypothetical protein